MINNWEVLLLHLDSKASFDLCYHVLNDLFSRSQFISVYQEQYLSDNEYNWTNWSNSAIFAKGAFLVGNEKIRALILDIASVVQYRSIRQLREYLESLQSPQDNSENIMDCL